MYTCNVISLNIKLSVRHGNSEVRAYNNEIMPMTRSLQLFTPSAPLWSVG